MAERRASPQYLVWFLWLSWGLALVFLWSQALPSDAFVTLRYSQALASGDVASQLASASTSAWDITPLYSAALSFAAWIGAPLIVTSVLLSAVGWVVLAVIWHRLLRESDYEPASYVLPALLVLSPAVTGSLSSSASWFLVVAWLAIRSTVLGQWRRQTAALLLLPFTFVSWQTVGLVVGLLAWRALRERAIPWRTLAAVAIPWLLALGALVWQARLARTTDLIPLEGWLDWWRSLVAQSEFYWYLLLLAALGLGRVRWAWGVAAWTMLALADSGLIAEAVVLSNLLFLAGLGSVEGARWLVSRGRIRLEEPTAVLGTVAFLLAPVAMAFISSLAEDYNQRPLALSALQEQAGQWIEQNSEPGARVVGPASAGFHARRAILATDAAGGAADDPRFVAAITANPPDFIVTDRSLAGQNLAGLPWFGERYAMVQAFANTAEGSAPLTVWAYEPSPLLRTPIRPLNVQVADRGKLVGYQQWPERIRPGDAVHVALHWQAQTPIERAFKTVVWLPSPVTGENQGLQDLLTPRSIPPEWWQPEQTVAETFVLTTTEQMPVGGYQINVSFREQNEDDMLPLFRDGDTNPLDRIQLDYVAVPGSESMAAATPTQVRFGDAIQLSAVALPELPLSPGDSTELTLYWQSPGGRPPGDYTVFVHLIDAVGDLVASGDSPPMSGQYPTGAWLPGEVIADRHVIDLPADLASGDYHLMVGLYDPASGERLPAVAESGQLLPNAAATLASFSVR